jgi:hypothetical protein
VSQEVIRVFYPASTPEGTTVQRGTELPTPDRLGLGRQVNGPLDQPSIQFMPNQSVPENDQRSLAERCMLDVHASNTSCQRRSITVASITSSSDAPVYA